MKSISPLRYSLSPPILRAYLRKKSALQSRFLSVSLQSNPAHIGNCESNLPFSTFTYSFTLLLLFSVENYFNTFENFDLKECTVLICADDEVCSSLCSENNLNCVNFTINQVRNDLLSCSSLLIISSIFFSLL